MIVLRKRNILFLNLNSGNRRGLTQSIHILIKRNGVIQVKGGRRYHVPVFHSKAMISDYMTTTVITAQHLKILRQNKIV